MKRKKHKSPSRLRYEESHPVVSFRISQDLHDRFKEVLKCRDQSVVEFFKDALDKQQDGFSPGALVALPCCCCGEPMALNTKVNPAVKTVLKEAFKTWGHIECLKKRDKQVEGKQLPSTS